MRRRGQRHGKIRVRVCGCISSNPSSLSSSSCCCFQLQFGFKSGETFGLQRFCYNNVMDMEIEDKLLAGKIRCTADPQIPSSTGCPTSRTALFSPAVNACLCQTFYFSVTCQRGMWPYRLCHGRFPVLVLLLQ